jgi:hypothetical protein
MKTSQRHFLVYVNGIPGPFATQEGGETEAAVTKVWDGGKKKPDLLSEPPDTSNLVMGRPYSPDEHQPIIDRLRPLAGQWRTTVTKQPTDPDFTPIGKPITYPNSLLVRMSEPELDASSGEAARWEVEFATSGAA